VGLTETKGGLVSQHEKLRGGLRKGRKFEQKGEGWQEAPKREN